MPPEPSTRHPTPDTRPRAPVVAVCADPASDVNLLKAAARIAVDVNLPFLEKPVSGGKARSSEYDMLLVVTSARLELRVLRGDPQIRGGLPVTCNLDKLDTTSPAGRSLKQPLFKAVGLKSRKDLPLTILDATAGWGEDAWLLAAAGCRILAVERNRIMATLLKDGVLRAATTGPDPAGLLARLTVISADSRPLLRRIARRVQESHHPLEARPEDLPGVREFFEPEVVYLDPMFPGHAGRKTAEKKPLRVLRALVGDDADQIELFQWAMQVATRRVVVKRPAKAPPILGPDHKPATAFAGKGFRFDVYLTKVHSSKLKVPS